jgi:hypothetical protein
MPETLPLDTFVNLVAEQSFDQLMSGDSGQIEDLTWPAAIYGVDTDKLYRKVRDRLKDMRIEYNLKRNRLRGEYYNPSRLCGEYYGIN